MLSPVCDGPSVYVTCSSVHRAVGEHRNQTTPSCTPLSLPAGVFYMNAAQNSATASTLQISDTEVVGNRAEGGRGEHLLHIALSFQGPADS